MKKFGFDLLKILFVLSLCTSLQAQVINEYVAEHTTNGGTIPGNDHEYIEFFGLPDTDYSDLWILQIDGDLFGDAGVIDTLYQVGTTDAEGLWQTGFLNAQLENSSMTLLLVSFFTGNLGDDLDTNDDGTFDAQPWFAILDSVGVDEGGVIYSSTHLTPNYDGINFLPGGASRIPNGTDTDTTGDWVRNDWNGEGFVGFTGSLASNEAINTPGELNMQQYPPAPPIINEFVADHVGNDSHEFIEINGDVARDYSFASILVLDSDELENPGQIDAVFPVGTTNSSGHWETTFMADQIEDGSLTLLLVENFTGAVGDDLDTNDDGIFESEPWVDLYDSVSITDGAAGDVFYSTSVIVTPGSVTGGASRIPSGVDTDQVSDWTRNDFDGEGLPGFTGDADSQEAINTPGSTNLKSLAGYYSDVDASSAVTLETTLHTTIDDHLMFPYSSTTGIDTWDILELADEDPTDSDKVIVVYKNESITKFGGGTGPYNREHTWPKSYGFSDAYDPCNSAATDCHHLMLSDPGYNTRRSNKFFDDCVSSCTTDPALFNPANGWSGENLYDSNSYEVWPERRGDIARAQFYLDVRYAGGVHGMTGCTEPNLRLTDNPLEITTSNSNMGLLSVLIQWHYDDPVDDVERLRNEVIYLFQGNRNPFVDHPEWVDCLYNDDCPVTLLACIQSKYSAWRNLPVSGCAGESTASVRSFIELVNETCACSP